MDGRCQLSRRTKVEGIARWRRCSNVSPLKNLSALLLVPGEWCTFDTPPLEPMGILGLYDLAKKEGLSNQIHLLLARHVWALYQLDLQNKSNINELKVVHREAFYSSNLDVEPCNWRIWCSGGTDSDIKRIHVWVMALPESPILKLNCILLMWCVVFSVYEHTTSLFSYKPLWGHMC